MQRYRFLLSFRWIVLTALVALAVVVMVRLGFWQLDRLHTKQAANALITARGNEPIADVGDVVPVDASGDAVDGVLKRQVRITGRYEPEDQVLIRNRSNNTAPGFWVITPIVTTDGTAVAVNRGWIPIPIGDGGSPDRYAPPAGEVTVTGTVERTEHAQGLESADPADGRLATLSFVDVERVQKQVAHRLRPAWVQLREQQPPQPDVLPVKITPALLDEGPHLNYAGQWFIYAALTCIVFPMAVRRAAKSREAKQRQAEGAGPFAGDIDASGEPIDALPDATGRPGEPAAETPAGSSVASSSDSDLRV